MLHIFDSSLHLKGKFDKSIKIKLLWLSLETLGDKTIMNIDNTLRDLVRCEGNRHRQKCNKEKTLPVTLHLALGIHKKKGRSPPESVVQDRMISKVWTLLMLSKIACSNVK
ncbi:Hypothetical predicted protein [Octopus vulgaris]|uniref:Uncharacterized protein n=1 Tax=Octopus vulgaris TaxID=6645 RepID=A0AA36F126_OCTVU|nr:Hypothetical predicted protein [Octopus vulgaris]